MKSRFFALFAVFVLTVAPAAHADRGIWFHNTAGGWTTYFNIVNLSTTNAATVRLTFYNTSGQEIGTVSKSVPANGLWSLGTDATGSATVTPSTLNASGRGVVKVSATGGKIAAYTSQFNATYNSGFNFIIGVSNDDGNDDGAADDSGLSDGFDNEVEQHQHSGLDK